MQEHQDIAPGLQSPGILLNRPRRGRRQNHGAMMTGDIQSCIMALSIDDNYLFNPGRPGRIDRSSNA